MLKRHEICVLVVDDEEGIREAVSINLEVDGFKVVTASGGDEAIELLKKTKVDFIISDVRMPKGDGVSLLKYVKEHYPSLPHIVLFSGYAEVNAEEVKKWAASI
jgi:DNA-binding NtrC family response regulator